MIRIILFVLVALTISTESHAALTAAEFARAMFNSDRYQAALTLSQNIKPTITLGSNFVQSGWYVSNGVEILSPVGSAAASKIMPSILEGGGSLLVKRGAGLLGPVAAAVAIGMTLADLYELVQDNEEEFPVLSGVAKRVPKSPTGPGLATGTKVSADGSHWYETQSTAGYQGTHGYGSNGSTQPDMVADGYFWTFQNVGGNTQATWAYPVGGQVPAPDAVYVPLPEFTELISTPTLDELYPTYQAEADKALQMGLDKGTAQMQPTPGQIGALAGLQSSAAAVKSTGDAVKTAQDIYDANPTPENKKVLDDAKAREAEAQSEQYEKENLVPPDVPNNTYDPAFDIPEKKSIPELLLSFVSSSPIVSMVQSFTMTASGSGVVPVGNVFGADMSFDFTRYETSLAACGGLLLVIVHGFAILVVVRGW